MKLKCNDGKTRRFLVCRNQTYNDAYGGVITTSKLLEAECVECGKTFGCHDTYILKPKFLAHACAVEHGVEPTVESVGTSPAVANQSEGESPA